MGGEEALAEESEEDGYLYVLWPCADEGRGVVASSTDSGEEEGYLYVPWPCVGGVGGRVSESDVLLCADGNGGDCARLAKDAGVGV